jgi:hypothetical protein
MLRPDSVADSHEPPSPICGLFVKENLIMSIVAFKLGKKILTSFRLSSHSSSGHELT